MYMDKVVFKILNKRSFKYNFHQPITAKKIMLTVLADIILRARYAKDMI